MSQHKSGNFDFVSCPFMQQSDAQTPLLIQYTGQPLPFPRCPSLSLRLSISRPRDPLQCLPFFFRQLTRYRLALRFSVLLANMLRPRPRQLRVDVARGRRRSRRGHADDGDGYRKGENENENERRGDGCQSASLNAPPRCGPLCLWFVSQSTAPVARVGSH